MLKSNSLTLKQLALGFSFSIFLAGPTCADTRVQSEVNSDSISAAATSTKPSVPDRTVAGAWKRVAWHTLAPAGGGALFSGITALAAPGLEGGGAPFIIYGLLIGPSMGNVYLEDYSGAFQGGLSRLGGGAIGMAGLITMAICSFVSEKPGEDNLGCLALGGSIFLTGTAVATVGTVLQLRKLPEAALNRKKAALRNRENNTSIRLALLPIWNPQRKTLGLNLTAAY
jgi:hypothetical protein